MIQPFQFTNTMLWPCNRHEQGAEENIGT